MRWWIVAIWMFTLAAVSYWSGIFYGRDTVVSYAKSEGYRDGLLECSARLDQVLAGLSMEQLKVRGK